MAGECCSECERVNGLPRGLACLRRSEGLRCCSWCRRDWQEQERRGSHDQRACYRVEWYTAGAASRCCSSNATPGSSSANAVEQLMPMSVVIRYRTPRKQEIRYETHQLSLASKSWTLVGVNESSFQVLHRSHARMDPPVGYLTCSGLNMN